MSFSDVLKKTFGEDFFSNISLPEIIINLCIVSLIAIFIYFIYRLKTKSEFYSKDFNIVLVGLPIITSSIVLSMQSNLALSLGMVGALSIVRFRNAVKSSLDLMFLFWSISIGIICGGGLYSLAIVVSIVLAIILILFDLIPIKKNNYLLVINTNNLECEDRIVKLLKESCKSYKIRSKGIHGINIDMIIELKCKDSNGLVKKCSKIKGVENVNLLLHDGDIRI